MMVAVIKFNVTLEEAQSIQLFPLIALLLLF